MLCFAEMNVIVRYEHVDSHTTYHIEVVYVKSYFCNNMNFNYYNTSVHRNKFQLE